MLAKVLIVIALTCICTFILIAHLSNYNAQESTTVFRLPVQLSFPSGWRGFDALQSSALPAAYVERPTVTELFFHASGDPSCAEGWIVNGTLCNAITSGFASRQSAAMRKLSIVYTWVNGSDAHTQEAKDALYKSDGVGRTPVSGRLKMPGKAQRHFAQHNELLYSMRSVAKSLPADEIADFHLITTDLPRSNDTTTRFGQVPSWLDRSKPCKNNLRLHHHWTLFKSRARDVTASKAEIWRNHALPSFSSNGIESQLTSLSRELRGTLLYFNDDLFVMNSLTSGDFASALHGPVIKLQSSLLIFSASKGMSRTDPEGEWPSMTYANWLLDQRFGARKRPYVQHFVKTYSASLLDEMAEIWGEELTEAASERFRGASNGGAPNIGFLATHYIVERQREALLWSFLVARSDEDGSKDYSYAERHKLLTELGWTGRNVFEVPRASRKPTQTPMEQLKTAGLPQPALTTYTFDSTQAGYAYSYLLGNQRKRAMGGPRIAPPIGKGRPMVAAQNDWPDYSADGRFGSSAMCKIDVKDCFGDGFGEDGWATPSVQDVFRRVAFERPHCGDCVISSLLKASGLAGFSAFLPKKPTEQTEPLLTNALGTAKIWQTTEYEEGSFHRAISLLQRYSYVIGDANSEMVGYMNSRVLNARLNNLQAQMRYRPYAFAALNDDTIDTITAKDLQQVDVVMGHFFTKYWPDKGCWES